MIAHHGCYYQVRAIEVPHHVSVIYLSLNRDLRWLAYSVPNLHSLHPAGQHTLARHNKCVIKRWWKCACICQSSNNVAC